MPFNIPSLVPVISQIKLLYGYKFAEVGSCVQEWPTVFTGQVYIRKTVILLLHFRQYGALFRVKSLTPSDPCLDKCLLLDYVVDVSTSQISKAFTTMFNSLSNSSPSPTNISPSPTNLAPNSTNFATSPTSSSSSVKEFVSFTVYYRTFDYTRVAYHGKVRINHKEIKL